MNVSTVSNNNNNNNNNNLETTLDYQLSSQRQKA